MLSRWVLEIIIIFPNSLLQWTALWATGASGESVLKVVEVDSRGGGKMFWWSHNATELCAPWSSQKQNIALKGTVGRVNSLPCFWFTLFHFSFPLFRGWAPGRSTVGNKWRWKIHSRERLVWWNRLQQLHLCQLLARQQREDDRQEKGRGICLEDW